MTTAPGVITAQFVNQKITTGHHEDIGYYLVLMNLVLIP